MTLVRISRLLLQYTSSIFPHLSQKRVISDKHGSLINCILDEVTHIVTSVVLVAGRTKSERVFYSKSLVGGKNGR